MPDAGRARPARPHRAEVRPRESDVDLPPRRHHRRHRRPSRHASGNAVDFDAGPRKAAILEWLIATHRSGGIMTYAGMDHIHVDIGPRFISLAGGRHWSSWSRPARRVASDLCAALAHLPLPARGERSGEGRPLAPPSSRSARRAYPGPRATRHIPVVSPVEPRLVGCGRPSTAKDGFPIRHSLRPRAVRPRQKGRGCDGYAGASSATLGPIPPGPESAGCAPSWEPRRAPWDPARVPGLPCGTRVTAFSAPAAV